MILEVDLARESAVIVAADPPLDDELLYETDALFYSPAQDVVEQKVADYRKYVPAEPVERPSYLKNFFPLLPYQTYLGIPLTIPGMATRHALFLLDEYRPTISDAVNEQANLAAQLIQVALERGLLLDLMHRYEQRYTQGQLLGSLIHELGNKLDALDGADNLVMSNYGRRKRDRGKKNRCSGWKKAGKQPYVWHAPNKICRS
jgi:signal transduction histidine kinase